MMYRVRDLFSHVKARSIELNNDKKVVGDGEYLVALS